jgi:hypothetical protein
MPGELAPDSELVVFTDGLFETLRDGGGRHNTKTFAAWLDSRAAQRAT